MVKVTFEFKTEKEAAAFLLGGKKGKTEDTDDTDLLGDGAEEPEDEVSHEMITEKVKELVTEDKANKPKIAALLTKYKVANVSKLPEEKLKTFLAALAKIG